MMKKTLWHLISGLACFTLDISLSHALPQDLKVISGSAQVETIDSHQMQIKTSDQSILNYSKFGIAKGEKVKFIQNSSSSCVLNKVTGKDPSQIFGSLESNGKVFLVNPNGVYFGPESQVSVGSLIVSTLHIADEDFLQGKYEFHLEDQIASIQNEGTLTAKESIALISPRIENKGVIQAKASVLLSAQHVTLDFMGDGLLQFSIEGSLKESLIEHLGEIQSSTVAMKIPAARKAISDLVNIDGVEPGEIFTEENGVIKLSPLSSVKADKIALEAGYVEIEGTLDSSHLTGTGGNVHIFGREILLKGALIDASGEGGGEVLIGGEFQGKGKTPYALRVLMDESSSILANARKSGDGGNIVLWSENHTLFTGKIEAKGGSLGGNGGIVETSSKEVLNAYGTVDGSAPLGNLGTWLLDPSNLIIGSGDCPFLCFTGPLGGNCSCNNVYVYTDCSLTPGQTVTICSNLSNCNIDLVLSATYGIYVQSTISMGAGSLSFSACNDSPGGIVPVFFQNGSAIHSNGRAIHFQSTAMVVLESDSMTVDLTHDGHSGGAALTLNAIQALDPSYSLILKPGTASTTSINTISTNSAIQKYNGDGTVSGPPQSTYPPGGVSLTGSVASFQISTLVTSGGPIDLGSQAVLVQGSATAIKTTGDGRSGGASLQMGTIDANTAGVQGVDLDAGNGVNLNIGNIGSIVPLGSVTIAGNNSTSAGVHLPSSITTQNGTITLNKSFTLSQNLALTTNGGAVNTSGATITSSFPINIATSGGSVSLGTTSLANTLGITSGNGAITLSNTASSNPITLNAGSGAISAGSVTMTTSSGTFTTNSGGSLTFTKIQTSDGIISILPVPIVLTSNGTLDTTNGGALGGASITLSTVDGSLTSGGLELAPSITINSGISVLTVGTIGGNHPLGSTTIFAASNFNLPNIFTANKSVVIYPQVLLSQDITINTVFGSGTGGSITLSSVDGAAHDLTLSAGSQFVKAGDLTSLDNLSISGAAVTLNGIVSINGNFTVTNSGLLSIELDSVTVGGAFQQLGLGTTNLSENLTAGTVFFTGPLTLGTPLTITANTGAFTSLNSITGDASDLTLTAATSISIGSLAVRSNDLTANGGGISIGSVTSGDTELTASGTISLGSLTASTVVMEAGNGITLSGAMNLSSTGLLTATGGNVSLQTVSSLSSLTVEANAGFISTGGVSAPSLTLESLTSSISTGTLTAQSDVILTAASSINLTGDLISSIGDATLNAGTFITITGSALIADVVQMTASSGTLSIGAEISAETGMLTAGGGINVATLLNIDDAILLATGGNISLPQIRAVTNLDVTVDAGNFSSGLINAGEASFDVLGFIDINGTVSVDTTLAFNLANGVTVGGNLTVSSVVLSSSLLGTVSFEAPVSIDVLTVDAGSYAVSILNGGEIFSSTAFNNTAGVTLIGSNTLSLIFDGGLSSTASPTSVSGQVATTSGGMSFASLTVLSAGASLTTAGSDIQVAGSVSLNGNGAFTTLGGDVIFSSTLEGPGGVQVSAAPGVLEFNAPIGLVTPVAYLTAINVTHVVIEGAIAVGDIAISSPVTLSLIGENLFQTSGLITFGDMNGISVGAQDLTLRAGKEITLGDLGSTFALGDVLIESGTAAFIKNIFTDGTIEIQIPTVLRETSSEALSLDTTAAVLSGHNVTLQRIDSTSQGTQGLTINAGTSSDVVLGGDIGVTTPIESLDISGKNLFIYGSLMSITGNQNYRPPTLIVSDIVTFNSFGNITFYSSLNTVSDLSTLSFYMGGGSFTLLGNTGNSNMGNLSIFNSGSFSSQQITANTLRVSGGRPTITLNSKVELAASGGIVLDGGPIYLGGEIDAAHLFFRSSGAMSNLYSPQPINIEGASPFLFEYINALGGNVGTPDNPIQLNAVQAPYLGANRRADFIGTPFHSSYFPIPSNPPCIVTFNGVTIFECTTKPTPQFIFDSIPKNLLYVPGIYSSWSWDMLSNPWYFEEMPFHLGQNPRNRTLFYIKPEPRKSKKVVIN